MVTTHNPPAIYNPTTLLHRPLIVLMVTNIKTSWTLAATTNSNHKMTPWIKVIGNQIATELTTTPWWRAIGTTSQTTLIAIGTTVVSMDRRVIIVIMRIIKEWIQVTMEAIITPAIIKNQPMMLTKLPNSNF